MGTRFVALLAIFLLAGCADDPQSCKASGGVWSGSTCSAR